MKGFGLVEIIIVTAIVTTALVGFLQTEVLSVKLLRNERENLEATLLAQETIEAVRGVRDESWTNKIAPLLNGTIYYPLIQNGKWILTTTPPPLVNGKYTRLAIFGEVRRNAQDKISPTGTIDPGTRSITSRVLWGRGEETTVSYEGGTTDGDLGNFPSQNSGNGDPVQEFRTPAGSPFRISSIDLLLKRVPATTPSDIFLEIRNGTQVGAVLGTSPTISSSLIPNTGLTWTKFTFPTTPTLNPSTQYFLRLRSTPSSNDAFSGSQQLINWGYRQIAGSPYPDGNAWRYVGRLSNPSDIGQVLTQYDFSFKINRETTTGKQIELIAYLTNFQEPLGGPTETKTIFYDGATTDGDLANFPSNNSGNGDPAQGFTTLASPISVSKVELFLKRTTASPSNIFAELRPSPTGAVLGVSNTITSTTISNSALTWVEFRFASPVALSALTKYYIRLRSIPSSNDAFSSSVGTINWGYLQTPPSPYAGGEARRYVGRLSNPSDTGQQLDQYDYGFRVYSTQ